ncbi:MAG: hypothetical protein ABFD69_10035 [Candidatus Sumerlaeia bacterium]
MRLNPDGSSDDSYHYELGYEAWSCGLQKDGKLVLSGDSAYSVSIGSIYVYERVLRLNPDGTLDRDLNFGVNPDHTIRAIARQADGKTVIGGDFDSISGFPRNHVARLNPDDTLDLSFDPGPGTNGCVSDLGVQPDGKVVITGEFTLAGGGARAGIARLNIDGSLDAAFNPEVNGAISQVVMRPSGDFYIRGLFTSINGTTRNYVARLKADGSLDASFIPPDSTTIPSCIAAQPDGKVLIGSSETGTSGKYAKMVRLNANGTLDTAFNPQFASGLLGVTKIVVLNEGGILAAASGPGSNEVKLSCFNSDGTTAALYRCDKYVLKGSIDSIAEQADGKVLIGGIFKTVPNESEQLGGDFTIFARLNTDGMPDAGFKGAFAPDNNVRAIVVRPDGKIMIGGDFARYNGAPSNHLALLNADGSLTTETLVASAPDGEVNAVATGLDGGIIIGGGFSSIYQSPRPGAARLGAGGDVNSTFTTNLRDVSVVAASPDGKVLVCDRPSAGSDARVITRRKADGTTDSSFAKVVVDARVDCMSVQTNGSVVIAGGFHSVKGYVRNQVARLSANGTMDQTFNPGDGVDLGEIVLPDDDGSEENHNEWLYHQSRGAISSIAVQTDGKIVVVGEFDRAGGVDRKNIARLNANGSHDASFDPGSGTDGKVFAVALQPDGKALIAGEFTKVDGKPRHGLARLNRDGSVDDAFVPDTNEFDYFLSLALQADGRILAAGFYNSNAGHGRVARLNADGSLDALFESPDPLSFTFGGVRAIALQSDGKLLAGGRFEVFGQTARRNFARISNPDAALQSLVVAPGGAGVTWRLGGSYPQPYQVLFEGSSDGVNWSALGWGTAVPGVGFAITHQRLPILTNHYVRATGWSTGGLGNGSVSIHRSTLRFFAPSYNAAPDWACYN